MLLFPSCILRCNNSKFIILYLVSYLKLYRVNSWGREPYDEAFVFLMYTEKVCFKIEQISMIFQDRRILIFFPPRLTKFQHPTLPEMHAV